MRLRTRVARKLLFGIPAAVYALLGTAYPVAALTVEDLIGKYFLPGSCTTSEGVPSISALFCIVAKIISILLGLGGAVALVFLAIGGLQYMASGGDEKALTTAKSTITYAVLGLIIILGSFLLVNQILLGLF